MAGLVKEKYFGLLLRITRKTRQIVLWIPVFSLIVGTALSVSVYIYLKDREIELRKANSLERVKEVINQLDLTISNSLLRIQTYEDFIGLRPVNSSQDNHYISQALEYTLFQRLIIIKDSNPKGINSKKSKLKSIARITRKNSTLPAITSSYVQSDEVLSAIKELKRNSSYYKTVLYEFSGVSRVSVVMKSKNHKDIFFIFSAPLLSLFDKIILNPSDSITIRNVNQVFGWKISNKNDSPEKTITRLTTMPISAKDNVFSFTFEKGLPQSGVVMDLDFNYAPENTNIVTAANIGGFLTITITFIISYLFSVLINLNRKSQNIVINKTLDLEKTTHDLQEALNGKSKFFGKISHEIRTPLNLIMGMIDLCEENDVDKKISSYLKTMKTSGEHLLSMIDDLLELAKAESNDFNFHGKKTYLIQFLSDLTKLCAPYCDAKGLKFYINFSEDLPTAIICDPNRLRQVLLNLLRNACKYTNHGYISLDVGLCPNLSFKKNQTALRFEIKDTGVGIPPDKLNKVFDAFFQVESASAFSEGGVGLGLSIVKDIVKKMNGHIEVSSDVQSGSIFRVDLEFEVFDPTPWILGYKSKNSEIKSVFVFTQDEKLRKSFQPFLKHPSLSLSFPKAQDFEKVLESLSDSDSRFVVIDSESIDFDFERYIKNRNLKSVVLIGKPKNNISQLVLSNVFVMGGNPFLISELFGYLGLSSRVQARTPSDSPLPTPETLVQDKLSLIVADDDIGNIELYKAYFSGTKWNVKYAFNGLEAWELYQTSTWDLMILDVRMPIMDGLKVISHVREKEKSEKIPLVPVIIVTADLLDYTAKQSQEFDNVILLTKPLKKSLLFENIGKMIGLKEKDN